MLHENQNQAGELALRNFATALCVPAMTSAQSKLVKVPMGGARSQWRNQSQKKVTKVLPSQVPMPKPFSVDAPKDAPNVVIVLLDDVGFGAPSPFGGKVNMPTLQAG